MTSRPCFYLDSPLFFFESLLALLHVLSDRILLQEVRRLSRVEALRVLQELVLERLLVHRQVLAPRRWVLLVKTLKENYYVRVQS